VNTWIRKILTGAPLLFLAAAASAQNPNPFFVPPVFPGSGASVTADFNGDGKPDLLFADGTVLLGNGDGTFTAGTKLGVAGLNAATFLAIADFNGDGRPDVVVNSATLNTFSVLLGNGDGTFQAAIVTSTASPVSSLTVGDLNGDGKPDVLVTAGSPAALYSFLGQGNGQFSAGVVSGGISAGQLADFNGDGKLDLMPVGGTGVQLAAGGGTFGALQAFPSGSLTGSVIGDFDGDGKLDVLAVGGTTANQQLQVLFGNGDGTFRASAAAPIPPGSISGSFSPSFDLNGDGKADTFVTRGDSIQVLTSNGDGTFTPGALYNVKNNFSIESQSLFNLSVADFNKDGKLDLAVFNTMLLGNGDGTLQGNTLAFNISAQLEGDLNGDGHPDLVGTSIDSNSNEFVDIYVNDGHANFTLTHSYSVPGPGIFSGFALAAVVDVDGDGLPDVVGYVAGTKTPISVVVLLGNGDGTFKPAVTSPGPFLQFLRNFSFADLRNNKKPDLLLVGTGEGPGTGTFEVMSNNGDGNFAAAVTYFAGGPNGTVAAADYNGDGNVDVFVGTDANGIAKLFGKGDGTFQPAAFLTNTLCGTTCFGLLSGDFNGDGKPDIIEPSTQSFQVLLGKGDGTFTGVTVNDPLDYPFQLADINGDGKLDVIRDLTGDVLSILFGNGDGTFLPPVVLQPAGTPLIADFNGDGRLDLFVDGVWLFNMGSVTPPPPDFSLSPVSGGTSATVSAGNTATFNLSLVGKGGFSGNIALSCSGAPTGAICTVAPAIVKLSGAAAVSATVTVTTTAHGEAVPVSFGKPPVGLQVRPILVISSLLASILLIVTIMKLSSVPRPRSFAFSVFAATTVSLFAIAGCGGGGGGGTSPGGNPSGGSQTGTPAGSYTIVIKATSGSGSTAISHATNLTLVIQ
jgi:hypothetical protein